MLENITNKLLELKKEFVKIYDGNSHIQELIPVSSTRDFPIEESHLKFLHDFATSNPIYYNSYEKTISKIQCRVYEGDINQYWLNSIKHGSSCQPFYPTWILSAYIIAYSAKILGFKELMDIGSGDGRIAYCGRFIGLKTTGIEIDEGLVSIQNDIATSTKVNFNPICQDALEFDYSSLNFKGCAFFIGGLPQMGGDVLAGKIINKISLFNSKNNGVVFTGSNSKKQLSTQSGKGGWSSLIDDNNLEIIKIVTVPTVWTFDQSEDTPYIFTKFR